MTDRTDYIYWLRDMAERGEMSIRPCPKALRRAADAWEKDKETIEMLKPPHISGNAWDGLIDRNIQLSVRVAKSEAMIKAIRDEVFEGADHVCDVKQFFYEYIDTDAGWEKLQALTNHTGDGS